MNTYYFNEGVFLLAALALLAGVTCHLDRYGRALLLQAYQGNLGITEPTLRLGAMGFLLINLCNLAFVFAYGGAAAEAKDFGTCLAFNLAWVLLVLTGTYFMVLDKFERLYKAARNCPPPTLAR